MPLNASVAIEASKPPMNACRNLLLLFVSPPTTLFPPGLHWTQIGFRTGVVVVLRQFSAAPEPPLQLQLSPEP
jgi:hypothetical protein